MTDGVQSYVNLGFEEAEGGGESRRAGPGKEDCQRLRVDQGAALKHAGCGEGLIEVTLSAETAVY